VLAKLIETSAPDRKEVPVTKEEFLIGRGPDCDLRLGSSEVSRHHCLLRVRGEEVTVSDLGSSNGTYLNGQRVRSQAALHSGDEIVLGKSRFLIDLGDQVDLGTSVSADPLAVTFRLPNAPHAKGGPEKERGHPPGERVAWGIRRGSSRGRNLRGRRRPGASVRQARDGRGSGGRGPPATIPGRAADGGFRPGRWGKRPGPNGSPRLPPTLLSQVGYF